MIIDLFGSALIDVKVDENDKLVVDFKRAKVLDALDSSHFIGDEPIPELI